MKKFYLIICLITVSVMCYAQGEASDFTGNKSDRPRDPRSDQMNFVLNEVLVKFKDDVAVSVTNHHLSWRGTGNQRI